MKILFLLLIPLLDQIEFALIFDHLGCNVLLTEGTDLIAQCTIGMGEGPFSYAVHIFMDATQRIPIRTICALIPGIYC